MVGMGGFEPPTLAVSGRCSPTELHAYIPKIYTRDPYLCQIESSHSFSFIARLEKDSAGVEKIPCFLKLVGLLWDDPQASIFEKISRSLHILMAMPWVEIPFSIWNPMDTSFSDFSQIPALESRVPIKSKSNNQRRIISSTPCTQSRILMLRCWISMIG